MAADLNALIARLEAAEGPSRELDARIQCHFEGFNYDRLIGGAEVIARDIDAPLYTVSIDIALTLVPDGMTYAVCGYSADAGMAIAKVGPRDANAADIPWSRHPVDAIALCIASLKARAKLSEARHD